MRKILSLVLVLGLVNLVQADELSRDNFNLIRKQTQQSSDDIQNVISQLNTIKGRLDQISKEREPQANLDVSPVQPSLPATNTEGWQFDASRNVWWRLTPVNTDPFATTNQLPQVNSVTPGRIFPSNFLPGGSQRGIITSPFRSIQNCGPSG